MKIQQQRYVKNKKAVQAQRQKAAAQRRQRSNSARRRNTAAAPSKRLNFKSNSKKRTSRTTYTPKNSTIVRSFNRGRANTTTIKPKTKAANTAPKKTTWQKVTTTYAKLQKSRRQLKRNLKLLERLAAKKSINALLQREGITSLNKKETRDYNKQRRREGRQLLYAKAIATTRFFKHKIWNPTRKKKNAK